MNKKFRDDNWYCFAKDLNATGTLIVVDYIMTFNMTDEDKLIILKQFLHNDIILSCLTNKQK